MRLRTLVIPFCALLAVAGGCAAVAGNGGPVRSSLPIALDPDRPALAEVGALRFRGALRLPGGAGVGGLSGLWVSDSGDRFVAVSDNGRSVTGRLSYDAQGHLTGAGRYDVHPLVIDKAPDYRGRLNDSEDLVRLPDGGWLAPFERNHRILRYGGSDRPEGTPRKLPTPPGLEEAPSNGGIEALAALPDGRILAIEEGDDDGVRERSAWIASAELKTRGDWQPLTYRAAPRFRPTAAAALSDGGVLVLERRVSLLGGWAARIVHVPADSLRGGATMDGVELARLEPPLLTDNFEGMAVRSGPDGDTLLYIVSDDNRSPLQRTYLMMFRLPAGALKPTIAGR
ncbi:esterase-like activity of phytase family protein [Azospirillum sp. YIM DDC1]|uniref:Esterase-like activity of phytase family protein n=1 Tax=Azospirillum aestuarii TaxID=2802052 RepID=A0ABS1HT69_9PROT|nr:esterase-like activity of phytase family protein [Azospirillum aestuarii]MBK4718034.1 esterase-like activity of phytase family protein [Azospirillum aestuarii]